MPEVPSRWRTAVVALLTAFAVMWLTGAISRWGQWYSDQPYYRAQVYAFFEGRLALTHNVEGVTHDIAWIDGGVQHVWGLGVPIWLSLWEMLARLVGASPFPDRIAMGLGMALAMYGLLRAWMGSTGERSVAARGAFVICAFLPGLLTMLRGRIAVYEEAEAYAYGSAMLLLAGIILMVRRPSKLTYLTLLTFAGATGLMRPTVWFYGFATYGIATLLYIQFRRGLRNSLPTVAIATALFLVGGGALYLTNYLRFGKGSEFGHRLNLEDLPGNIYATRFEYPFQKVGLLEASKELFGGMFGRPEKKARAGYFFYEKELHAGQSTQPRWREYYFTTYTWAYVPIILAGIALTILGWLRSRRKLPEDAARREATAYTLLRESRWLGAWALVGTVPLLLFYLHSPSVSSRYFLDVAPGVVVLMTIAWRHVVSWIQMSWLRGLAFIALCVWWGWSAIAFTQRRPWQSPLRANAAIANMTSRANPLPGGRPIPDAYDLDDPRLDLYIGGDQMMCKCYLDANRQRACDHTGYGETEAYVQYRDDDRLVTMWVPNDAEPTCHLDGEHAKECSVDAPDPKPPTVVTEPREVLVSDLALAPLYRNGTNWDLHSGQVSVATYFFVDDPEYVEVEVSPAYGPAPLDWKPMVRAKVQLEELERESISSTARGVRFRFKGPKTPRYQTGLQVIFLAFGPPDYVDESRSDYKLWRVAWRDHHRDVSASR